MICPARSALLGRPFHRLGDPSSISSVRSARSRRGLM
jgi:hypothetical protein